MKKKVERMLELAKGEFGDLTPADVRFFTAVARGVIANYQERDKEKDKPENAGKWGEERVLNADRIVWVCTDEDAKGLVTHSGIWIAGAMITGKVDLPLVDLPFVLSFLFCLFKEKINLPYSRVAGLYFNGSHTKAISANGLKVTGDLSFRGGFRASGEVSLPGIEIGGEIVCESVNIGNPGGNEAFDISRSKVNGRISFFDDCCIKGEMNLKGTEIGGNLELEGLHITGTNGTAISADRIKVKGSVFLRKVYKKEDKVRLFKAEGEVRLFGADVGGNLDCIGGEFINRGGNAICAEMIRVRDNVLCCGDFKAEGTVCLHGARIQGGFQWQGVREAHKASLDFCSANIKTLWITPDSWPKQGNLHLNGLIYDELDDLALLKADDCISFLNLQPQNQYHPQPYEQMAKVLKKSGREEAAKKVLIEKNKIRLKRGGLKGWDWIKLKGTLLVYKTWDRPMWTGIIALAFIITGTVLFGAGYKTGVLGAVRK